MTEQFFTNKEKSFDLWAPNYDCLLTTVFYQAIHQRLLEFIQLPDDAQVLDLGCGTGQLLNRLATKFPTLRGFGLDLSSEMIRQARRHNQHQPRLIFLRGNAESLPFAQHQFDAVFNTISFFNHCLFSQANFKFYSLQQREELGVAAGLTCLGHHYLLGGVVLSIFEKRKSLEEVTSNLKVL